MHPYHLVRDFVQHSKNIEWLNFSLYKYERNSVLDEREFISLSRSDFLSNKIDNIIANSPKNFELAFHSNVILNNGIRMHIPLFDMATSAKGQLLFLEKFLPNNIYSNLVWFNSGRSFHGYSTTLINEDEWVKLMGVLLLVNQKGMTPIVDPRWIGHRLIGGFSALRWTKNTSNYIIQPTSI